MAVHGQRRGNDPWSAAGEQVPPLQCLDAVSNGTAELGHDARYYHLGKNVGFGFFSAFPFGLTGSEMTGWINHGGGQALWDELSAQYNVKAFQAGNSGPQMFGWFRKEISSVEDLRGLKYRTGGVAGGRRDPPGHARSGAVDTAEWIGPYKDLPLGLFQVAPYYYTPGFAELGSAFQLMVNKQKYDALPSDLKAIIRVASQAAHDDIYGESVPRTRWRRRSPTASSATATPPCRGAGSARWRSIRPDPCPSIWW